MENARRHYVPKEQSTKENLQCNGISTSYCEKNACDLDRKDCREIRYREKDTCENRTTDCQEIGR